LRTSRTRARDRSKTSVHNSYIRYVYLRRKRTDNGKVPGGRGAQPGQEDLHELQCSKRHKGDALQEVWLQRPQDKDPGNEESLDHLHPHDCSIISNRRAGALKNRGKKKGGGGDSTAVGHHPLVTPLLFLRKSVFAKMAAPSSILQTITFLMARRRIAAIPPHGWLWNEQFSNKDSFN